MSYQLVIDPSVFAREAGLLQGRLPVAGFSRLLDLLAEVVGAVRYRIEGRFSERERPQLFLKLEGALSLPCRRCLGGVAYPLQVRNLLEFVDDESRLTQEEIEDDSRDFIPWQSTVDVVSLIEDEIILALPSAPHHERCDLPALGQKVDVDVALSPFSVLEGLKVRKTK